MDPNMLLKHPMLKSISQEKLKMFLELFQQSASKNSNELLPFLLAASRKTGGNMRFSDAEADLMIKVMKQNMPAGEQQRVDQMLNMIKLMSLQK